MIRGSPPVADAADAATVPAPAAAAPAKNWRRDAFLSVKPTVIRLLAPLLKLNRGTVTRQQP